jgi:hypothetical protein
MTLQVTSQVQQKVLARFVSGWEETQFTHAFACLGRIYADAMRHCWSHLPKDVVVHSAHGSIGGMASQLKHWLENGQTGEVAPSSVPIRGEAVLRGVKLRVTPEQVIDLAVREMTIDSKGASSFQSWYVLIDGHRIAPKWLVSRLTGIQVARFRTEDALRVLRTLGIECLHSH